MRRLHSLLILAFVSIFLTQTYVQALTIYQARGLKKDKCYAEKAAINCREDQCTMNLFPMTHAQLSLSIVQTPKELRMVMGHFFDVNFKVKTEAGDQIEILKWKAIPIRKVTKDIQSSDGMLKKTKCIPTS